ncbi:MAG: hypothetical protein A3E82_08175 [Gammaproteobacteria bacterium RIFCSPHIGHO2_12_FULL_38_11]|nr:MAG: hypothetical protein A3E82_08175 [Gammaproteobacteria bacterium RIFCSPHIGHO2_12_FULL_38_11]
MKTLFLLISLTFSAISPAFAAIAPLSPEQAFQFSGTAKDYQTVLLTWKIAPNYYLYQKHFSFRAIKPANAQLGNPLFPSNTQVFKTSLGNFDVYANTLMIPIPIIQSNEKNILLQVHYQGCSKTGYCYPPITKLISINLSANYMQPVSALNIDIAPNIKSITPNKFETLLAKHSFSLMMIGFLGFGLLLSLTPCVLPMIPILSSIIVGQKNKAHSHTFLLSLFYVLGMAITYAIAGVLFAILGSNVQIVFQQPWIIICFSFLFILMALSLFGFFTIQLPEKWRAYIAEKSYHQKSGSYFGVAIMGCLSTLILSPCVTPPLVAVLGFISQSGNALLGGAALFSIGIGMGAPLLLIGALGTRILPKPGKWMNIIKYILGILLLVIAAMMIQRTLPHFKKSTSALPFQAVHSVADITTAIDTASTENKPVMLDFAANWCIACKEFDSLTFSNPSVKRKLADFILLRADVTDNSVENQIIEKNYGVVAPPTILFFYNGQEIANSRVIGYLPPQKFLKHLDVISANVQITASN